MKKILVLLIVMLYVLSGCTAPSGDAPTTSSEANTSSASSTEPITTATASAQQRVFVTTLFPQYDFARTIAGDLADVVLIIPPGVEAHSYEPTPQDIITMDKALAVFFTNPEMEPWMERIASSLNSFIFDLSRNIKLREHDHDHAHDHSHDHAHDKDHDHDHKHDDKDHDHDHHHDDKDHGHDHDHNDNGHDHDHDHDHDHHHGVDPHYWLDPANALIMANEILYTMIELLPEFEMQLRNNAAPLLSELEELDRILTERTAKLAQRRIVTGGHFAFGYFAEKYDLEAISPFENLSPDAEPSPQKLAEIVDYVRDHDVKVIFHEELLDPKIAQMIATETGAKMLQLHAAHNVSKEELQNGVTYVQIMLENMKNLEEGLGVR